MRKSAFCEYCMNENEYKVHKINKTSILRDEEINYIAKEAYCNNCGNNIFASEICDYNLKILYEKYRKKYNIIMIIEIQRIITKYSISPKSLSLLLGWEKGTVYRYLDGDIPTNPDSDILKKIYENPDYYSIILQTNKERIEPVEYSKSRQSVKNILNKNITEYKVDAVIKYLLIRCEDLTLQSLQKLLYYVQAFYYIFTDSFIFEEDCEAFMDGPVYRSIYERSKALGYEEFTECILSNNKLELDDVERNVVESIIKFYGCYSGKILKQMTCNEAPWVYTRTKSINEHRFDSENFSEIIEKNLISEYFKGIKDKYNMENLLDIQKYSEDLFNKLSM